ncbi:hypothetical protein AGMMS49921_01140 [Endomicrobiia bacterium]|nr:hypothetical protein AGMMS49921_01140 [Endomicrobiia bacterium]
MLNPEYEPTPSRGDSYDGSVDVDQKHSIFSDYMTTVDVRLNPKINQIKDGYWTTITALMMKLSKN